MRSFLAAATLAFGRLRCFHQQVAEHPRAGFTNPQKAFALSRGTFHRIEARISSYLSLVAKATDRLQRVHNAKGGEQANAGMGTQAGDADITFALRFEPRHGL